MSVGISTGIGDGEVSEGDADLLLRFTNGSWMPAICLGCRSILHGHRKVVDWKKSKDTINR